MSMAPKTAPNEDADGKRQQLSIQDKKKLSGMVKFLSRAFIQAQTFGIAHPLAKQPIDQCFTLLSDLLQEKGSIALFIADKKLRYGNTLLEERNPVVDRMIELFTAVEIVSFEFEQGLARDDFLKLLSVFAANPDDIIKAGGAEKLINDKKIAHLKVNPIKYELVGIDEKVVEKNESEPQALDIAQEALEKLQKQLADRKDKDKDQDSEEKDKKPKVKIEKTELLSLIDTSLKEETKQSLFVDKLTSNPLEVVNLITDALRLLNKVGTDNARAILSNIVNKLALVGDDLYRRISEGREDDENAKKTYKAAGTLGKELTARIKNMKLAPELDESTQEMNTVLMVLLDQMEAQKALSGFSKDKLTPKKKAKLLKKVVQREKSSPEFGMLMKKLLTLKGMPEEEADKLIDEKEEFLKTLQSNKEAKVNQIFMVTLQRLQDGKLTINAATEELKQALKKSK